MGEKMEHTPILKSADAVIIQNAVHNYWREHKGEYQRWNTEHKWSFFGVDFYIGVDVSKEIAQVLKQAGHNDLAQRYGRHLIDFIVQDLNCC